MSTHNNHTHQAGKKPLGESLKAKAEIFYNKHYKKLAVIPTVFGILAILLIVMQYVQTGDFMNRGISLKGGTTITIDTDSEVSADLLEAAFLEAYPKEEFNVRVLKSQGLVKSISIETSIAGTEVDGVVPLFEQASGVDITKDDYSVETIGSSLSNSFFSEMLKILIFAFVLMGVVVFIYFRSPAPSFYVLLCAFFDLVITLAIVNMIGLKMTTAGIAAFLMLISFSIDTDVLLTARMLKREEGVRIFDAIWSAFGTGMTMTATVLGAVIAAFLLSNSPEIQQIMIILAIGLVVDMMVTWLQNASLIRLYVESKEAKERR